MLKCKLTSKGNLRIAIRIKTCPNCNDLLQIEQIFPLDRNLDINRITFVSGDAEKENCSFTQGQSLC